jgi:hypothetical protein
LLAQVSWLAFEHELRYEPMGDTGLGDHGGISSIAILHRLSLDAVLPLLAHFVAGAASCPITRYAKLAIAKGVKLMSMRAVARGHFDRGMSGALQDIIHEIAIESPASERAIREIARQAELICYAHNA